MGCAAYLPDCPWTLGFVLLSCGWLLLFLFHALRWGRAFGVTALLWLFLLGGWSLSLARLAVAHDLPATPRDYRVQLLDTPGEHERSRSCRVRLLAEGDGATFHPCRGHAVCLCYFPKDSLTALLRRGDCLWMRTTLEAPATRGNPDEFDYPSYLLRRGVGSTAYVARGHWHPVSALVPLSWRLRADNLRDSLTATYARWGFRGELLAVLSALTLGDKSGIGQQLRQTYQVAGASHVLALSGLHVGLLALLLSWLCLPLVCRVGWLRYPAAAASVLLLWLFAWMTGGSASAVRATLMFSLLLLAAFPFRERLTSEVLAATAFWMLVFRPWWLYDVGFQLSFAAVAALLWLQPLIVALWCPRSVALQRLWQLAGVATAAWLGTAPLVLYYFSSLPLHFLLANLWIVPWTLLILLSTALLWLLFPFPLLHQAWCVVVQTLVEAQHVSLRHIGSLPGASWQGLYIDKVELVLLYLLLGALGWLLLRRAYRPLQTVCGLLLLLLLYGGWAYASRRPQRSLCFYNVRHAPVVHCLAADGRSWLVCADSLADVDRLSRTLSAHWLRLRLQPPVRLTDSGEAPGLHLSDGLLTYGHCRVCLLSDYRWRGRRVASPLPVDYLLVTSTYRGTLSEVQPLFNLREVVLDPSLSPRRRALLAEECRRLHLSCHDLDSQGALLVPLP